MRIRISDYEERKYPSTQTERTPMRALLCLVGVFVTSSLLLIAVFSLAPALPGHAHLIFPRNLEQLRSLADTLQEYKNDHFWYTVSLFSLAYLFKQTYAIPGSFLMNVLSGALFGAWSGSLLVILLTALGASFCYLLSALFARPILERCFTQRLNQLRRKFSSERDRLFLFLLSARVFPFTPHWLLNICSPFLDVPLATHFGSVGIGLVPYNVICVRAGRLLSSLNSLNDVIDTSSLIELFSLASLLFVVAYFARRRKTNHLPHLATD